MIEDEIRKRSSEGALLAVLIDPFSTDPNKAGKVAHEAESGGADIILVGGSIGAGAMLDTVISSIKSSSSLPVILFPGNVDGVSGKADAILFMSLLNSSNPYWIIQAQALAAITVKKLRIEAIPTAYLIFEPGHRSAAGWVGWVNPIPRKKPEIALAYSAAAELLGMRWVYLEAGSGAEEPVPVEAVKMVSENTRLGIIVGGGIRSPELAAERAKAGADIIVVGTYLEEGEDIKGRVELIKRAIRR
ncbi:MAG: geranylgeranylglyceryl/heptaprenylglyceryl phosphate synthase [Candidatus Methanodesulfokora sp.]|jgi:phosphoglycerol geranylgeranyltransferase|nr:MAG: geranylgeranylglyceryl/heptaprenylglyceryl phosphate synthase [Candidatus Korarchaeota archaeon]